MSPSLSPRRRRSYMIKHTPEERGSSMSTTLVDDALSTTIAHNISDFRAAVNDSFVPLQVSSDHPDRFRGMIRGAGVDEVHVSDVRATDHVVERTPELIARGDRPHFKVSLMLAGSGLLIQDG